MGLISTTGPLNLAAEKFNVQHGSQVLTGIPRQKFQFSVNFILNPQVTLEDDSFGRFFTFDRVSSAGLPDFDYSLVRLNQYNRPRFVATRLETQPITIIFYDTKDNQFGYLLMAYAQHYFHGHKLDPTTASAYDVINGNFASGESNNFGAKSIPGDQRFFFEQIIINQQDTAQGGRRTTLHNVMLANVNHDRLDYSDSNPVQYTAQFQAEHVNIDALPASSQQNADAQAVQGGREASIVANRNSGVQTTQTIGNIVTDGSGNAVTDSYGNPVTEG